LRASGVTVAGALGGIAFGLALSSVVVRLVHVTAESGAPVPPLVRVFGWPVIALAFVALVLLGVALTEGSARTAFHEDVPRRPVGP
jgi:CDP-diglyceride synthetase